MKHFEDLWMECETFHKNSEENQSSSSIADELMIKMNLYKIIAERQEIPAEDLKGLKARALGEILLTITNLSLNEDIDVFKSLTAALQERVFVKLDKKFPKINQTNK